MYGNLEVPHLWQAFARQWTNEAFIGKIKLHERHAVDIWNSRSKKSLLQVSKGRPLESDDFVAEGGRTIGHCHCAHLSFLSKRHMCFSNARVSDESGARLRNRSIRDPGKLESRSNCQSQFALKVSNRLKEELWKLQLRLSKFREGTISFSGPCDLVQELWLKEYL